MTTPGAHPAQWQDDGEFARTAAAKLQRQVDVDSTRSPASPSARRSSSGSTWPPWGTPPAGATPT